MIFTRRFLLLLSIGVLPLIFAGISPIFIYLTAGYDLILLALVILEFSLTSRQSPGLIRQHEKRLSLGAENTVWINIWNKSQLGMRIEVKDEYPHQFEAKNYFLHALISPNSKIVLRYTVVPTERGDYQFGNINYRFSCSPLGLIKRERRQESRDEVKVYPNLIDIRKFELIHRRSHLIETGLKRSRLRGQGTDFESLREYVPDDDAAWVDWKSTAKHGRPISKNYELERTQELLLIVDAGRMMATRVGNLTKLDYAVNASLMLGYTAIHQGDQVGALAFSDEIVSFTPPSKQLNPLMEALYPLKVKLCEPDYNKVCIFLSRHHRKRSLIVIFTDLSDARSSSPLYSFTSALVPRHLPLVVAITDPDLIEASQIMPDDSLSIYEKAVANRLLTEREQVLSNLIQKGALALDVPASKLSVALVNKYLEIKAKSKL